MEEDAEGPSSFLNALYLKKTSTHSVRRGFGIRYDSSSARDG